MEYKTALVIVQLTLASVYSRKSSFRDFAFRKTMKLKLKVSCVCFSSPEYPVELTNVGDLHLKLKG